MYRFIPPWPPLIVLVLQNSNVALYAQVCFVFCVCHCSDVESGLPERSEESKEGDKPIHRAPLR